MLCSLFVEMLLGMCFAQYSWVVLTHNLTRAITWDTHVVWLNYKLATSYGWADMPEDEPHPLAALVRKIILVARSFTRVVASIPVYLLPGRHSKVSEHGTPRNSDIQMHQGPIGDISHGFQWIKAQGEHTVAVTRFTESVNKVFTNRFLELCIKESIEKWEVGS